MAGRAAAAAASRTHLRGERVEGCSVKAKRALDEVLAHLSVLTIGDALLLIVAYLAHRAAAELPPLVCVLRAGPKGCAPCGCVPPHRLARRCALPPHPAPRTSLFLESKLGNDDASSSTPHANDAPGYTAIASS